MTASSDGSIDGANDVVSVPCPTGPAPSPVLVAHTGLDQTYVGLEVAQSSDEFFATVKSPVPYGPSEYRVVAISKCGSVREVVSPRAGPMASLAVDGDVLFVADDNGILYSVPTSGGSPQIIASAIGVGPIAVDETDVYLSANKQVVRIPRAGGAPTLIANHHGSIAVDDTFVFLFGNDIGLLRIAKSDPSQVAVLSAAPSYEYAYWWADYLQLALSPTQVFFPQLDAQTWQVCALPKQGGDAVCTTSFAGAPSSILWNASAYFGKVGQILRMDSTTGIVSTVAKTAPPFTKLWVDDASVFWLTATGDLYRVDK